MYNTNEIYKKYCRIYGLLYGAAGVALGIYNIFYSTPYYIMLAFASVLFLLAPAALNKLLGLKPVYMLHLLIYIFCTFAFMGGMVLNGYILMPYFDKMVHTLSGVVFGLLGVCLFYHMKPEKKIQKEDYALVSSFCVSFACFTAVVWEAYEYVLNMALHTDPQHVLDTGVNDTMQDMIVCLIGALFVWRSLHSYFIKGKSGILLKTFESFYHINMRSQDK